MNVPTLEELPPGGPALPITRTCYRWITVAIAGQDAVSECMKALADAASYEWDVAPLQTPCLIYGGEE